MSQLTDFIRARKSQMGAPDIDWEAKKNIYLISLEKLYSRVEELLREAIESGDVVVRQSHESLYEESVGAYLAPMLEVHIGSERVFFRPKGISVIGVSGRVDLIGEGGSVTLLRDEPDEHGGWSVILRRVPTVEIVPLDEASLKLALEKAMLPVP